MIPEQRENILITQKLETVFQRLSPPVAGYASFLSFDRPGGNFRSVWMGANWDGVDRSEAFVNQPPALTPPCYFLEDCLNIRVGLPKYYTTPYGILPTWVVGPDNKLYLFENVYYLDQDGQAMKYEGIICESADEDTEEDLEYTLRNVGLSRNGVMTLDKIIPDEKDSRYVRLEPGDYEHIGAILQMIKSGQLVAEED